VGAGLAGRIYVGQFLDIRGNVALGQVPACAHADHSRGGANCDGVEPVESSIALHGVSRLY
jgi:hypothetical protein